VICGGWYSWQSATFAREESDCLFIQNAVVLLPHGLGANGALELGTAAALTKNFRANGDAAELSFWIASSSPLQYVF
jgi:hypothetical protein